jgi:RNase P/RNase MRP subunit p30
MKKAYVDLHLCPDLRDSEQVSQMLNKASRLGYSLVAMTFQPNCTQEEIQRLRNLCTETRIDLAPRVDLKPKSPKELISSLRKLRRKFEIVAVACESKSVARQAAKDRRVDVLSFPSTDFRGRFFDRAEAELASKALASLEVDAKQVLTLEAAARVKLLASLRRETAIAKGFRVPIILSSGVSNPMLMRKPMDMAALASLFDLDKNDALKAVSQNPTAIVRRNREKLSSRFVAPGIRIIRRGKGCLRE